MEGVEVRYKFTETGRKPGYGRNDYPAVGEWSEKRTPILCRSGWHVPVLLSEWIMPELWKVEVRGRHVGDKQKIAWEQIRFIERVDDWDIACMRDFIGYCCNRNDAYAAAADAAYADAYADAADAYAAAADAAYAAAAYDAAAAAYADAAYVSRRRYQHNWIVGRLNLGREMEVEA